MNEEYEKGQEIGELRADIKNMSNLLERNLEKQGVWNENTDARLKIAEAWIQTTTGKVVILTAMISFIGWLAYQLINWLISVKFK